MAVRDVVQAAAGVGGEDNLYVEDVFSTYLYTGNDSIQPTIVNNIDLAGEGGMVWIKSRDDTPDHYIFDTERGLPYLIVNDDFSQQNLPYDYFVSYNSDGFTGANKYNINKNNGKFASWTFRKSPKFFDVVTWSGNDTPRIISHNLDTVPGCIIVKRTNASDIWAVWHRSLNNATAISPNGLVLNSTEATGPFDSWFNGTQITSTGFGIKTNSGINASGGTYVAYLFAHDAGGFGADGEQNVISCGSYTTVNGEASINLGYEPQWVMVKRADGFGNWFLLDNMRSLANDRLYGETQYSLSANITNAEANFASPYVTATGFENNGWLASAGTFIYIAIRRPMKTPESGAEVFASSLGRSANPNYVSGFPVDFAMSEYRVNGANWTSSRLQGSNGMDTASTGSEGADGSTKWDFMDGHYIGGRTTSFVSWMFRRAPSVFDVVAYTTETGSFTRPHNLGVAPEIMILKNRGGFGWYFMSSAAGTDKTFFMQTSIAPYIARDYWPTDPDASNLYLGGQSSGFSYIAYLFASLAGVSKCGSYIGTGADLNVDCGFSSGARFVLIKRYDGTPGSNVGDWYVWDSARGIVAGNDPYLLLNNTAAEVTSTDYIDPLASGFTVTSSAPAAINASGGNYIFLAIA